MKIVSSGKVLNSRAFYKKKKRRKRIQLIFLSIGFLLVLSSLIYLSRQERFLVAEVAVLGEDVIDKEEIRGVAKRLLRGYYFWIVPRANSFVTRATLSSVVLLKNFQGSSLLIWI